MLLLILTSFVWALSFGLVKGQLTGVDPLAVSCLRLAAATLVFLPLLRPRRLTLGNALRIAGIGAIQFGLTYIFYLMSYQYLQAWEVALFTVFTPLYVVLLDAFMERAWKMGFLWASLLAALGALIIQAPHALSGSHWKGILLLQAANLSFAAGQLLWRRQHERMKGSCSDAAAFALAYLGALLASLGASLPLTDWSSLSLSPTQWGVIAYLGAIASGLCFFLWNRGATKVNAGTLAVMNNLKVPAGVLVSLLVFGEQAAWLPLLGGGVVIACGLVLANKTTARTQRSD